jgi:hypothetical protein
MRQIIPFAALLLVALPGVSEASVPVGCHPDPTATYSEADAGAFIRKSEAEWATSVATNDASVLRRILADDFVWVLDQRVIDKPTAIREAEEGPGPFVSNVLDYVHIRFYGTTAVAQGSEHWVKRNPDRPGRFIWTDTWVLCAGKWRIVSSQDNSAGPQ